MTRRNVLAAVAAALLGHSSGNAGDGRRPAASGARRPQAGDTPRPVTRGESTHTGEQRANVDWLNCTFDDPSVGVEVVIDQLSKVLRRPVSGMDAGRGKFGFLHQVELLAHVGSRKQIMGSIAYGGESQRGRWMLQITGGGCGLITDWAPMVVLLESLGADITRLDLCVDFMEGQRTVEEARAAWREGGFTNAGRPPSTSLAGDWDTNTGRTYYVGKAKNGKLFRAYEKGHQLGDVTSPWVRYEVQFGNRDRTIPMDALTQRDRYFAGAYPILAEVLHDADATRIETQQTDGETTLGHLLTHLRRTYGKAVDAMSALAGFEIASLVEEVRVTGLPRRLKSSSLAAAPNWSRVIDQARKETL